MKKATELSDFGLTEEDIPNITRSGVYTEQVDNFKASGVKSASVALAPDKKLLTVMQGLRKAATKAGGVTVVQRTQNGSTKVYLLSTDTTSEV